MSYDNKQQGNVQYAQTGGYPQLQGISPNVDMSDALGKQPPYGADATIDMIGSSIQIKHKAKFATICWYVNISRREALFQN